MLLQQLDQLCCIWGLLESKVVLLKSEGSLAYCFLAVALTVEISENYYT